MRDATFEALARLALKATGQFISPTRDYLVEARLAHIVRREGFGSTDDLADCLKARPNPVFEAEIVAALLNHDSWFFRERDTLERVVDDILPDRLRASKAGRLKVWCAGGGSGQEAYSLAIRLAELAHTPLGKARVQILSTDVCRKSTEQARAGLYGHFNVQKGLSVQRLLEHFERHESGQWQISEAMRDRVSFREHNLMQDCSGLGQFDLIFCRHALEGMERQCRRDVAERLAGQLAPGGVVLLGQDETLTGLTEALEPSHRFRGGWQIPAVQSTRSVA